MWDTVQCVAKTTWLSLLRCSNLIASQAKQRDVLGREQKRQEELANQVELVKATLGKAATELAQKTAENKGAREDLDHKRCAAPPGQ